MEITDDQRLVNLIKMKDKTLNRFELLTKEQAIMHIYNLTVVSFSSHKDYMNLQRKLIDGFINEDADIMAIEKKK